MAKRRKLAALLACVMLASSAAGCGDTQYSAKIGDDEVKAGVYIGYVSTILTNEINSLYYQGITEDPFSQQIDGVSFSQYIKDESLKSLKEYCAVTKQFANEGLTITDAEMKTLNANLRESWDNMGEYYEYEGVSKESLKELYLAALKREKLFDHYYDKDGKEAVSDEELKKFFNENYLRYKVITFYTTTQSDEEKQKEENEKKQKERDEFFEKGKDLSFDEFDKLIDEYKEYSKAQSDKDKDDSSSGSSSDASSGSSSESSSESKADGSSGSSSDSSDDSDDSQASVDSSSEDSSDDSSDTSSEEDSSSQPQNDSSSGNSSDDSSKDDDEEEDPYVNEVIINSNNYKDDTESPSGKLFKFINELDTDKVSKFENDYGYYIIIKGDITKREDYVEKNHESLLHALKDEDFGKLVEGWIAGSGITVNDKALKRYTPEVIYDRINAYYEKHQG